MRFSERQLSPERLLVGGSEAFECSAEPSKLLGSLEALKRVQLWLGISKRKSFVGTETLSRSKL